MPATGRRPQIQGTHILDKIDRFLSYLRVRKGLHFIELPISPLQ